MEPQTPAPKTNLPILLTILISVIVIGGIFLYFEARQNALIQEISTLNSRSQLTPATTTPVTQKPVLPTTTSKSESETEIKAATTTVTAYVYAIEGNKISLDYFDALFGPEAEKAAIADGRCTQAEIDNHDGCFPNGTIYDRNVNPKLRQFTISPNVKITTASAFETSPNGVEKLTINQFKARYLGTKDENGKIRLSPPYQITINEKSEVVLMEEIFRP